MPKASVSCGVAGASGVLGWERGLRCWRGDGEVLVCCGTLQLELPHLGYDEPMPLIERHVSWPGAPLKKNDPPLSVCEEACLSLLSHAADARDELRHV